MNIIECYWDKDSLGLETKEIILKADTSLEYFRRMFVEVEYNVLKLPVRSTIAAKDIKDYNFIETQIEYDLKISSFIENKIISKMLSKVSMKKVINIDEFFLKLDESLFDTDRVSIDEEFGPIIGLKRYKNWMLSLTENNQAEIFEIIYESEAIGFFCCSEKENQIKAILGGIYSKWKQLGLGLSIILCPIRIAQDRGMKRISTKISSNNFEVLKLYDYLNFKITSMNYVFTKHNKRQG